MKLEIKSRKYQITITVSDMGTFWCPKHAFQTTVEICEGRKARRFRGCLGCKLSNQVSRKAGKED